MSDSHVMCTQSCGSRRRICLQLEAERQQEGERAAKVHDEMRAAHSRLKLIEKELKQLTSNQVGRPAWRWCP